MQPFTARRWHFDSKIFAKDFVTVSPTASSLLTPKQRSRPNFTELLMTAASSTATPGGDQVPAPRSPVASRRKKNYYAGPRVLADCYIPMLDSDVDNVRLVLSDPEHPMNDDYQWDILADVRGVLYHRSGQPDDLIPGVLRTRVSPLRANGESDEEEDEEGEEGQGTQSDSRKRKDAPLQQLEKVQDMLETKPYQVTQEGCQRIQLFIKNRLVFMIEQNHTEAFFAAILKDAIGIETDHPSWPSLFANGSKFRNNLKNKTLNAALARGFIWLTHDEEGKKWLVHVEKKRKSWTDSKGSTHILTPPSSLFKDPFYHSLGIAKEIFHCCRSAIDWDKLHTNGVMNDMGKRLAGKALAIVRGECYHAAKDYMEGPLVNSSKKGTGSRDQALFNYLRDVDATFAITVPDPRPDHEGKKLGLFPPLRDSRQYKKRAKNVEKRSVVSSELLEEQEGFVKEITMDLPPVNFNIDPLFV
ncbi:hypothetical protein BJ508DRAFT_330045 [Ascobolus immersus RN42]|uniref:Uncharacterized protein n=1 Tax=Ascobolus immersus RN42 TaxID=1160509 RepID=A0A3N4I6Y2_ASCIM|nr:hypothetical protein BJ508DRAFT_330045 [Ascobolus immersus RN42]